MEKLTLIIVIGILLFGSNTVFSQGKIIEGLVLDSLKEPVKYANVGVLNKPIGTVTNEKGEFLLNIGNSLTLDTLKISSLGFTNKEFIIKNIPENSKLNVTLESSVIELKEVTIIPSNQKRYTEGKEKTNTKNEVFFTNPEFTYMNLGAEIGRKFPIGKKKISLLEEFKFFIKKNNFKKIKFRVNIYNIKNNMPLNRINNADIYAEVENLTGWIKVDLTGYDIMVQENVIITIEWIEASKEGGILSLPILVPSLNSIHYYKQSAQTKWKEYKMISSAMVLTYKQ